MQQVTFEDADETGEFYVIIYVNEGLLGAHLIEASNILQGENEVSTPRVLNLIEKHPSIFKGMGGAVYSWEIKQKLDAYSVPLSSPLRTPVTLEKAVEQQNPKMEEGVIAEVQEPT